MKYAFGRFFSRLDTTEENISELEDIPIKSLEMKKLREQILKRRTLEMREAGTFLRKYY